MKIKNITPFRAFSLIELLVALVISSIVIGIACKMYLVANQQFRQYKKGADQTTREVVFKGLLKADFFQSLAVVRKSERSIEARLVDKVINYEWNDKYVVRIGAGVKDTFFIPVTSTGLKFQNKEQGQSDELIDQMVIVSKEDGQEQDFCFFKEYSAEVLMQHTHEQH